MSEDERLLKLAQVHVRYPRLNDLHEDIKSCHEYYFLGGEPQCIALTGETGAGKTTLVKLYAEHFPRYETPNGTSIPCFYFQTPATITVKGMAEEMLWQLGDPAWYKGTQPQLNRRLKFLLEQCKVELVILDDFDHLFNSLTDFILSEVSDWLKVLIKDTGIPVVVVGKEDDVESLLEFNPQLARLFPLREALEPFPWDPENTEAWEDVSKFIKQVETASGINLTTRIPRHELAYRIHYATNGVIAHIMNLLRNSANLAVKQGCAEIDLILLSKVFKKRLSNLAPGKVNPFEVPENERFSPPGDEGDSNRKPRRRPGSGRKRRLGK